MALPAALKLQSLDLVEAVTPVPSIVLEDFQIEPQRDTQWCWAAVAISIQRFYQGNEFSEQCALVTAVLREQFRPDIVCCPATIERECNQKSATSIAIGKTLHLSELIGQAVSFKTIKGEIHHPQKGRPICCSLSGADKMGGHAVVLYGWDEADGDGWVYVKDPLGEEDEYQPYSSFRINEEREWQSTCLTLKKIGGQ